jgi:uncharacterized peroxidase-related enzyme
MSQLTPLSNEQAPSRARALFEALQAKIRMVPNIFRTMGHAPQVLEHTLGLNEAIQHDLDPKLRELAYLTASRINLCGYCEHYHRNFARQAGLNDAQIQKAGLDVESDLYTDLERLVIRFADEWTRQGKASAEVVSALSAHLSPTQMVVLAATVALANWTNRFNETFSIQLP